MRLTCPNCEAQYEVPDDVIPPEGRDVQCSSCGKTWFQDHPDNVTDESADTLEQPEPAPDEEIAPRQDEPDPEPEQVDEVEEAEDLNDSDEREEEEEAPAHPSSTPAPAPARKELDPAVADILRAEAEAEQEKRRQQSSEPLESQPDLGLEEADEGDESARRTLEARKRMARMRGEPEPMSEAEVTAAAISSRRDLLPDIEEINSTLRTESGRNGSEDQADMEGPTMQRKRRSFRSGFMVMVVLFVLLALLYIYAPQIAQRAPGMDPLLSAYVGWVDGLRLGLDGYVQGALRWLDNAATQSGG